MLAAHVPDLEVHVVEGDGGYVLPDRGHGGFAGGGQWGGVVVVEGFDGGEEGRFAGVVEAEEEDGVFYLWREGGFSRNSDSLKKLRRDSKESYPINIPSLAVAQK